LFDGQALNGEEKLRSRARGRIIQTEDAMLIFAPHIEAAVVKEGSRGVSAGDDAPHTTRRQPDNFFRHHS
jgi:hypothetical protein